MAQAAAAPAASIPDTYQAKCNCTVKSPGADAAKVTRGRGSPAQAQGSSRCSSQPAGNVTWGALGVGSDVATHLMRGSASSAA